MWLSRSFTIGLGIHLVPVSLIAVFAVLGMIFDGDPRLIEVIGSLLTYLYLFGMGLWWHDRNLRKQKKEMTMVLWLESLVFMILVVWLYCGAVGTDDLLPNPEHPRFRGAAMPLIYPVYLLVLSVVGCVRAWQLRPEPPGLPLPREW